MKTNSSLKKFPDQTFTISLTIKKDQIATEQQKVLTSIQKTYKSSGFRQGKVPLNIISQNTSEPQIVKEIISRLIPPIYTEFVKNYQLKPIIQPQVQFKNPPIDLNKDWQIEITGCQLPQFTLKNTYTSQIKKINQTKNNNKDKNNQILETIIKNCQINLPNILIQTDLQKRLSSLIDQTRQAGITINQYLQSKNTNLEDYKKHLNKQIKKEWTIDLALNQIAKTQNLKVTEKDIKKASPKNIPPSNPNLLHHVLLQRKVLDYLQKL